MFVSRLFSYFMIFFSEAHLLLIWTERPVASPTESQQNKLCGFVTCAVTQGPALGKGPILALCSAVAVLIFLMLFGRGGLHFHFVMSSANYVGSLDGQP